MSTFKTWVSAARPRTLPLALSCIFMGSFLAAFKGVFQINIFIWAVITTTLLQVLSNFANDYGDTVNGADSDKRVGPLRAVQSGSIPVNTMKKAVYITGILSFLAGLNLLWVSFGATHYAYFMSFLALGILAIQAAYFYTAGSRPYGYAGLGDISVFLFFGLLGVLGVYFLFAKSVDLLIILPAISCGLLATGVLNLNNIRDINSDRETGKMTLPARWGASKSRVYHVILLAGAMLAMVLFQALSPNISFWYLLSFPLLVLNIKKLYSLPNPDPLLKQLALSTLLFVLLSGASMLY